ncbi:MULTISPECIES: DUF6555 family protein [Pseudomonas]|jgi:hypothetical protein|uniref:DUF6555 family protein n=1 Tax=Pseudomonas TaxID=286 RepID=UPI001C4F8D4A|nr:DUF6555 family protein [Pseudomonas sp. D1HM]MBW0236049.1 hypothetical protein [Pseudomonas sp. D1HM]
MMSSDLFTIEYRLHGERKAFVIRLEQMTNAEAWHWASCDAGVALIPRYGQQNIKRVSRPLAEKYGITDVRWRGSATLDWSTGRAP